MVTAVTEAEKIKEVSVVVIMETSVTAATAVRTVNMAVKVRRKR